MHLLLAVLASLQMALWIGLSAFGAHALKDTLTPASLALWDTASLYLGIGSLVVLSLSLLLPTLTRPLWLLEVGVLLFSLSLYALALGAPSIVGAITPLGGLSMMFSFLWLAYALYGINTQLV